MSDSLKPRIFKYDNVKLLAIILVVIGSVADEFTGSSDIFRSWFVFSYSFTAPIFVFLCGLFQKQYDGEKIKPEWGRVTFYLMAGTLLKVIVFLIRLAFGREAKLDLLGGTGIEWYLFVTAGYMLLLYPLRRVNRYVLLGITVVIGVVAGYLPIGDFLYLMRFLVFLPFYVAGYFLSPMKVRRFTHRLNVKLAGVAFIFIYFVLCFRERDTIYPLRMLFTGRNPYSAVPIDGCSFLHRLLCYGISAVLIISILACMPNRKFPVLTKLGKNVAGVYLWHWPIVLLLSYLGAFDFIVSLGDPLWKYIMIVGAAGLALLLSIPIFNKPVTIVGEAMRRLPVKACLIINAVGVAIAAALQFTVL